MQDSVDAKIDETTLRRKWRAEYVDAFLAQVGVVKNSLGPSTRKCLDDWARQVQLVEAQPSANWGNAILNLCRAVESELSSMGKISGLDFMKSKQALGSKAQSLKRFKPDPSVKQAVTNRGIKPGFVFSSLADLLSKLADVRAKTDSAHGGLEIGTATKKDAEEARQLGGKILVGIVSRGPGT